MRQLFLPQRPMSGNGTSTRHSSRAEREKMDRSCGGTAIIASTQVRAVDMSRNGACL